MNKNLELIKSEINNLNILSEMNNIDEIIKRSSILIKKYPKIQIFYNFLGSSLEKKNQIYEAQTVYSKSLELDPNNSYALINLGRISRITNDLQRSEYLLNKALDSDPENLFAQLYYGELKVEQNKFKDAISIFEKIYKKNNDFQNIIMRLANTYSIIGDFKKAEKYFYIASKKNPGLFSSTFCNRLDIFDFVADRIDSQGAAGSSSYYGRIDTLADLTNTKFAMNRTNTIGRGVYPICNMQVYDVAITVLEDAPINQETGLSETTIAVGTADGVSILSHYRNQASEVNTGTGNNQVMGSGGGGIFDAGGVIGIEGEMTSFVQQDIAPGEIALSDIDYPDPPQLQIVSPVGNEKYQAFNSSLGYIDIVWYRKYFDNDASFNIQLLKKEIDGTLSFVSLITANTQGSPAGQDKRKFRAYLGGGFNQGGTIFNPPSGNNYTIGIFRNTTFGYENISAYMGAGTAGTDNYDINNITTFRIVDPLEESPLVYSENVNLTGGDVIDNLQPELLITQRPLETFANPDYDINFDIFLHNEVGYEKIRNLDQGMFLNSYSITSLSEYFATSFEEYYLRNRRIVKKVAPATFAKIDLIHRGDIEYDY